MKRIIIIIFFILSFITSLFAQYSFLNNNGQTINTCSGTFISDSTLAINTYYTITFCSAIAGERISVDLTNACIEAGDTLYVYDGPNTLSPVMHKYPYPTYCVPGYVSNASGSCITFKFFNSTDMSTWDAAISCSVPPAAPVGCNGNPPAANFCKDAPTICNINGYCGNTSSYYTADLPGNMCEECGLFLGTIQNNSWFKLIADTTFVEFQVTVDSCTKDLGIQIGVYAATECNDFKIISDSELTSGASGYKTANTTFNVRVPFDSLNTFLAKGQTVYFMVDGMAGDVCNYSVKALSGILTVSAGTNQSVCFGQSAQLKAKGAKTYKWNHSESLNNPNIYDPIATPTVTTTYTCTFTGGNISDCPQTAIDSVVITVNPLPVINMVKDTAFCFGKSVLLNAGANWIKYKWNNSSNKDTLRVSKTGVYSVTVTSQNGCVNSDSVKVLVNPLPVIALGKDTALCYKKSILLNAGGSQNKYKWSNNSTSDTLRVSKTGTYSVTVTAQNGCVNSDSVKVIEDTLNYNIFKTDTICPGASLTLYAVPNTEPPAPNSFTYTWNDNSHSEQITVDKQGTYSVTITDVNKCTAIETIQVISYPSETVNLGKNKIIDYDTTIILDAGGGFNKYTWQDGSGNQTYTVDKQGKYWVTVIDKNGCKFSDTIFIEVTCLSRSVFIPNVFTPDNVQSMCDSYFRIEGRCLQKVEVEIFNRWGVDIYWNDYDFSSYQYETICNDTKHNDFVGNFGKLYYYILWDGTDKRNGGKAAAGAYFYIITYNISDNNLTKTLSAKGSITLIR